MPELISDEIDRIARVVVDAAFQVHVALGPGLLESVYESCLCHELAERNIRFERQKLLPVRYRNLQIDAGLRLDLLVEECVIVEIKSVESLHPIHEAQLITYLKLSDLRLGLLINFNVMRIKDGIKRMAR
jgi:GxxExxY protein